MLPRAAYQALQGGSFPVCTALREIVRQKLVRAHVPVFRARYSSGRRCAGWMGAVEALVQLLLATSSM